MFKQADELLTSDQHRHLAQVFGEYQDTCTKGLYDIGRTHLLEHEIYILGAKLIKQPETKVPFWKRILVVWNKNANQ